MQFRLEIEDLNNPADLATLKNTITRLANELDVLYTTTAPNGNISARIGRVAIYNNGGVKSMWQNTDGVSTWVQMAGASDLLWEVDGTEHQLKTADEIDMQSKKIINLLDPTGNQDASSKKYVDDQFDTTSGHDHDGTDAKKVLATNLDGTGINSGELLYNNAGAIAGTKWPASGIVFMWHGSDTGATNSYTLGLHASLTPDISATTATYHFWGSDGTATGKKIFNSLYIHNASISTLTIRGRLWSSNASSGRDATLSVKIGALDAVTVSSDASTTPAWYTGETTIDVSGLTPGTAYTLAIELKNEVADYDAYCSGIIISGT